MDGHKRGCSLGRGCSIPTLETLQNTKKVGVRDQLQQRGEVSKHNFDL